MKFLIVIINHQIRFLKLAQTFQFLVCLPQHHLLEVHSIFTVISLGYVQAEYFLYHLHFNVHTLKKHVDSLFCDGNGLPMFAVLG